MHLSYIAERKRRHRCVAIVTGGPELGCVVTFISVESKVQP